MHQYYQELQNSIHEQNKAVGWWDDVNRWTVTTKLMLTITELAEACEGDRKNLMDDKVTHRKMLEVELADTMIRALDLGGHLEYEIPKNLEVSIQNVLYVFNEYSDMPIPAHLMSICHMVCKLAAVVNERNYTELIGVIHATCEYLNLDLKGAIEDKRKYNAERADHKRENRQGEVGQKAY